MSDLLGLKNIVNMKNYYLKIKITNVTEDIKI